MPWGGVSVTLTSGTWSIKACRTAEILITGFLMWLNPKYSEKLESSSLSDFL